MKKLHLISSALLFSTILFCSSECKEQANEENSEVTETVETKEIDTETEVNQTPGLSKLVNSKWRLLKYNENKIDREEYNEEAFILILEENYNYAFSLDVNNCVGSVQMQDKGMINFEMPGCTEMCCDSKLAMQISNALSTIEKYRMPQLNYLILTGGENYLAFEAVVE